MWHFLDELDDDACKIFNFTDVKYNVDPCTIYYGAEEKKLNSFREMIGGREIEAKTSTSN